MNSCPEKIWFSTQVKSRKYSIVNLDPKKFGVPIKILLDPRNFGSGMTIFIKYRNFNKTT